MSNLKELLDQNWATQGRQRQPGGLSGAISLIRFTIFGSRFAILRAMTGACSCVRTTSTMRVKVAHELSTRRKYQLLFMCYEDVTWLCSALKTNLLNRACYLMRNRKTNDTSCQLSTDLDTTCAIE